MKNKKTIIILTISTIILIGGIFILTRKDTQQPEGTNTDAMKFKTEYESINGKTNEKNQKTIRSISIPANNPFVYQTAEEIVKRIEDKETFAVYFGFSDCPWCRSVLPTLIEVASDLNVTTIYYVDVKEIRDVMELDDSNKPITTKKGSDAYYRLTELLNDLLEDYNLTNSKNKVVKTHTKRIYAPNIITVIDGKPSRIASGISSLETDPYMELTEEIKEDTYRKLQTVLTDVATASVCNPEGC